ncbi:hypothetical protein [Acidovorax sp. NCPPB 3576]|uniref:hypothetical protein n=1 Tax=Acidovorax sp. NCPPB 3576 TaxID=2940488 RepID=UPI0023498564|nr:hypothetical protein [Acidovorax sp. NCPPB 3576]WCM89976.1 hypothetical protein M5C98_08115 [Acidovorax sp. NCPPB 3576]
MFLFLIVLMALRGLTGNAMAAGMLPAAGMAMHAMHAPVELLQDTFQELPHGLSGADHGDSPTHSATPDPSPAHPLHAAQAQAPATSPSLPPCHGEAAAAPAGAADAGHGAAGDASAHTSGHAHEGGCSACGICHSAMLAPALADPARAALPRAPLPLAERRFASALAAPAIKPPIS